MPMQLRHHGAATDFADAAMLYLLQHETEHCLLIGIVATLIGGRHSWREPFRFITVESGGRPVAAAVRTPPYGPAISKVTDLAAIPLLVDAFAEDATVNGVTGPTTEARAFATEWTRRTGRQVAGVMEERIYRLDRVRPSRPVPGRMRMAAPADRDVLVAWTEAFSSEALGENAMLDQARRMVDARLDGAEGGLVIWEDGDPVSMAGFAGPTPNGIRIGPVYTPPGCRRRGYASALVAQLSQRLLDEGRAFCALFTDLANPTSNRIYQEIGYEPVADVSQYRFAISQEVD